MYVISVKAPISWGTQIGFFTKCYRAGTSGEGCATWIGFTDRDEEWSKIKQFKTYKEAQNKLKFLEKKKEENGYMWDWELAIEPITEEDIVEKVEG